MSRKRPSEKNSIDYAVQYFVKAKSRFKVKGNEDLLSALDTLEEVSETRGLQPDHIDQLLDVAASGTQGITVSKRIIKSLIPATVVPESAVLKAISSLCTRNPPISIQCLLLRWILVVYEHIDSLERVHALYNILFHFLHYRTLMPYVCHLLFLLTRREDIKLFRVRQLIQYQRDMGKQSYLTGLLTIYRNYYPYLIQGVLPRTFKSFFPNHDKKWCDQVRRVHEASTPMPVEVSMDPALAERLQPTVQTTDLMPARKRRKVGPIPCLSSQSSQCNSDRRRDGTREQLGLTEIPITTLKNLKEFQENMEKIQLPSQIMAVLKNQILQHLMSYSKDPVSALRFQYCVSETLEKELVDYNKEKDPSRLHRLLHSLKAFSDFLQEGLPAVDIFLASYLQHWNGLDFSTTILKLISRCRLYSFEDFSSKVLEPLRKVFFMSSVYVKCKVVLCLTELLRNYAANEWLRFQSENDVGLFDVVNSFDGIGSIVNFVHYTCRLMSVAVVCEKSHPLLEFCILNFLELVSRLHTRYDLPFNILKEPKLFERLCMSPNPITVSRISSVLCGYKMGITSLKKLQQTEEVTVVSRSEQKKLTATCNELIKVFLNSLWRHRAFTLKCSQSLFNFDPVELDSALFKMKEVRKCLSIVGHHPAFLGFYYEFCSDIGMDQLHARHEEEERVEFLAHLKDKHMDGLAELVTAFMRPGGSSRASETQQLQLTQTASILH